MSLAGALIMKWQIWVALYELFRLVSAATHLLIYVLLLPLSLDADVFFALSVFTYTHIYIKEKKKEGKKHVKPLFLRADLTARGRQALTRQRKRRREENTCTQNDLQS